tara:strand:+ start:975 stop:1862 length:888 start_codon:yes stop_codon:yes gene_type:complete
VSKGPRLDQFYTNDNVVQQCLELVDCDDYDVVVEPSAGSGAFYSHLPANKRVGVDLVPAYDGVIEQDYFKFVEIARACQMLPVKGRNYLVVGNPPFGKNSSLAKRFFNASALFADTIAFIVPRTFRKPSTINQLNKYFHLSKEIMLDKNSFHLPNGKTHDVPCVFQVWERYTRPRSQIVTVTTCKDFKFVEIKKQKAAPPTEAAKENQRRTATLCVRRVGAGAGQLYDDYRTVERDWKSHYYIKGSNSKVREVLSQIVWDDNSGKYDTAGNPSISKNDLIRNYYKTKESLRKDLR